MVFWGFVTCNSPNCLADLITSYFALACSVHGAVVAVAALCCCAPGKCTGPDTYVALFQSDAGHKRNHLVMTIVNDKKSEVWDKLLHAASNMSCSAS